MVLALSMALTAMPLPALAQSAPPDTAKAARWAVEAGLLPDMGEGAFPPGKRPDVDDMVGSIHGIFVMFYYY